MRKRLEPGPGQESVWDYPRPPRLEACPREIEVIAGGTRLAYTRQSYRVLETSHPPVYYMPPGDVELGHLEPSGRRTACEWKGVATYFHVVLPDRRIENAGWSYPQPTRAFEPIRGYLAFYPHLMDACFVDGEQVDTQQGGFYGGWITSDIVGPFKGPPGTSFW